MYVVDFLRIHGVWFEQLLFAPASSSAKRAGNVHVPGRRVAKSVLVKAGDSFVLAVLPATSRIDMGRLSETVGAAASPVRIATPDELLALFHDCEPGVVPPFGRLYGLTTVVDSTLAESAEIIVGANTRHEGLRMLFRDFQALEAPVGASFTHPISPDPETPISSHRKRNRRAG
jgi:Ala-tRNA(Pro) deacylase